MNYVTIVNDRMRKGMRITFTDNSVIYRPAGCKPFRATATDSLRLRVDQAIALGYTIVDNHRKG